MIYPDVRPRQVGGGLSGSQQFESANRDSPGLLVLDALLRPLCGNKQAVSIILYPESPHKNKRFEHLLLHRIGSLFAKREGSLGSKFPREFVSGKRRYQVQAFMLTSFVDNGTGPAWVVLLERNPRSSPDLSRISRKFRLTQRETEALELLMQGYTTRQIASEMRISPNTAKTYLSFIASKAGVSHRAGLLAKILQISNGVTPSIGHTRDSRPTQRTGTRVGIWAQK
jgi:DNA-binding CsgD family transcriptional regulator